MQAKAPPPPWKVAAHGPSSPSGAPITSSVPIQVQRQNVPRHQHHNPNHIHSHAHGRPPLGPELLPVGGKRPLDPGQGDMQMAQKRARMMTYGQMQNNPVLSANTIVPHQQTKPIPMYMIPVEQKQFGGGVQSRDLSADDFDGTEGFDSSENNSYQNNSSKQARLVLRELDNGTCDVRVAPREPRVVDLGVLMASFETTIREQMERYHAMNKKFDIAVVNFTGCGMDDRCVAIIMSVLIGLKIFVHTLKLSKNAITDVGLQCIAEYITKSTRPVTTLYVSRNHITRDGATEFLSSVICSKKFPYNGQPLQCRLAGNPIRDAKHLLVDLRKSIKANCEDFKGNPQRSIHISGTAVPADEKSEKHPKCILELPFFLDPEITALRPDSIGQKSILPLSARGQPVPTIPADGWWQPVVEVGNTGDYNLDGNYYGGGADSGSGSCYSASERALSAVEQLNSRYGGSELHAFTVTVDVDAGAMAGSVLATTGGAEGTNEQKLAVWLDASGNVCAGAHHATHGVTSPGCSTPDQSCVSGSYKICGAVDTSSSAATVDFVYNPDTRYDWEIADSADPAFHARAELFVNGARANVQILDLGGKVSSMRSGTGSLTIVDGAHPTCQVGGSPTTWTSWMREGAPSDRLFWDGCDWQLQRKEGFPSGPFSSTSCGDQVDAANFIFCSDVSEWSSEICSAVKDAGYCSNALTSALCPATCAWPYPPTCQGDDAEAARELHVKLDLELPTENLARDQGQYLCDSLCNIHGLSYDLGVSAVCRTTCPGDGARRRLTMSSASSGLMADRRLSMTFSDTAVGRWSSFLWANAPDADCTPGAPSTTALVDTDVCDAHIFQQMVDGVSFSQSCPEANCYDTVTTGYCVLEHATPPVNAPLCASVCDTDPSHSGCDLEEENDWSAICDTRANCESYCDSVEDCNSIDMGLGVDRCYLNTASSSTCSVIRETPMYAILDKRVGGHGHATCWSTTHDKYMQFSNIDPAAVGLSAHTCQSKCRGPGSDPSHSDCRGADNLEDLHDDLSEQYALCVTREVCESFCDGIDGCHSIDMHKGLPRCLLNSVYTTPDDIASATSDTSEYDFLSRTRATPCHWNLAVTDALLPGSAVEMYSPAAANVSVNLAPAVGKYETVTSYDDVGVEVNDNEWSHEAASAAVSWDASGCRWQLSVGDVLLNSNVWQADSVRCNSVATDRVDERPALDSVNWYLVSCPRRVSAYWEAKCEELECACRTEEQCVVADYEIDRCMKFHNGDLGLQGVGSACDAALDGVHAHSMVAPHRGETWGDGGTWHTQRTSPSATSVIVTTNDYWVDNTDYAPSVEHVVVSTTLINGTSFYSGGTYDPSASVFAGFSSDFKTDLIRVIRHGVDCAPINSSSCASVELTIPGGDPATGYVAFGYDSVGDVDAGIGSPVFDLSMPVTNAGADANGNGVHTVEICAGDITFALKADTNECLANPCPGIKVCTNTIGSYTCTCPSGSTDVDGVCTYPSIPIEDAPPLHTAVHITNQFATCGSWQVAHFALYSDDSCQSQLSDSEATRFESIPNTSPVVPAPEPPPAPLPEPVASPPPQPVPVENVADNVTAPQATPDQEDSAHLFVSVPGLLEAVFCTNTLGLTVADVLDSLTAPVVEDVVAETPSANETTEQPAANETVEQPATNQTDADAPANVTDGNTTLEEAMQNEVVVNVFNTLVNGSNDDSAAAPAEDAIAVAIRNAFGHLSLQDVRALLIDLGQEQVSCSHDNLINDWDAANDVEGLAITDSIRQYAYHAGQFWSTEGLSAQGAYVMEVSDASRSVGSVKLVHNLVNNAEHPKGVTLRTQRFAEASTSTTFTLAEQAEGSATVGANHGARLEVAHKGLLAPRWGSSQALSRDVLTASLDNDGCFSLTCGGSLEGGLAYAAESAIHIYTNTNNDCDCRHLCQGNPGCHAFSYHVADARCTLHGTADTVASSASTSVIVYGTPGVMVTNVVEDAVASSTAGTVSVEGKGLPTGIAARMSRIKLVPVADATSAADCSQRQPEGVIGVGCSSSGVCSTRPSSATSTLHVWDDVTLPYSSAMPYFQVCHCQGRCQLPWQYLPVPSGRIQVLHQGFEYTTTSLVEDSFDVAVSEEPLLADDAATTGLAIKIVHLEGSRLSHSDSTRCDASAASEFVAGAVSQTDYVTTFTFDWVDAAAKAAGGTFLVCLGGARLSSVNGDAYLVVARTASPPAGYFNTQSFAANPNTTFSATVRGTGLGDQTGVVLTSCTAAEVDDMTPDLISASSDSVTFSGVAPATAGVYSMCIGGISVGSLRVINSPAVPQKFILGGWDAQSLEIAIPNGARVRPDEYTEAIGLIAWDEVCGLTDSIDYFVSSNISSESVTYRLVGHGNGESYRLTGGRFRICSQFSPESSFDVEIGEVQVSGAECGIKHGLAQNDEVCFQQASGGKVCVPAVSVQDYTGPTPPVINPEWPDMGTPLCVEEDGMF
eukprot:gene219-147_t